MKTSFLRPGYFIWIIVPVALYLTFLAIGLPHFIWSYDWRDNGTYDPFAKRYYTRCTYIGPYGSFTERFPDNGKCDWFQFHKKRGNN